MWNKDSSRNYTLHKIRHAKPKPMDYENWVAFWKLIKRDWWFYTGLIVLIIWVLILIG